jgi:heme/copper-type cytochrome/quinol oxidase subunit 3
MQGNLFNLGTPLSRTIFDHARWIFLPLLVRSHAHARYHAPLMSLPTAVQNPCLMDAILACSALHLSQRTPSLRTVALQYYSKAVAWTRERIQNSTVDGTEDWLILTLVFFYLFEVRYAVSFRRITSTFLDAGMVSPSVPSWLVNREKAC